MNIDEMPAGTEMDRLVAEKVMGWDPSEWHQGQDCRRWKPSNDIAHAWEVVEKMEATMRHFSLFYCETRCEWLCRLDKCRCVEEDARIKAWGEAAPLAICRAALKAVHELK